MYSIDELSILFLPNSLPQEQQAFALACEDKAVDYDSRSWGAVQDFELNTNQIKLNLVRTVFQVQENYDGVVNEILNSLEIWSDQTLVFSDFSDDDQLFVERIYAFLAFAHFTYLPSVRQIFVLGSRILTLAAIWNLPIISRVERHFARFCNLEILSQDAGLFAKAIENNPTLLTETETVSVIVQKYRDAGLAADPTDYLESLKKTETLDDVLAEAFWIILTLYHGLVTETIWKYINYSICLHAKTDKAEFDPIAFYLHRLEQTSDLHDWIQDHEEIAEWAKDKDTATVKNLLKIVKNKFSAETDFEAILNLTGSLAAQGHPEAAEIFYFAEAEGKFIWSDI